MSPNKVQIKIQISIRMWACESRTF